MPTATQQNQTKQEANNENWSKDLSGPPIDREATKNKPVYETRLGRIKAAVFENENAPSKVVFSALYKNDEDQWRASSSFTREDLPLLMKLADQVHTHLYES